MKKLNETIFYSLEKSIKNYRRLAQKKIKEANFDMTIDQWLILTTLQDNPDFRQKEVAKAVFKDLASMTRIIKILTKKKYLNRSVDVTDRRKFNLSITKKGEQIIDQIKPIVQSYRKSALKGISKQKITELDALLNKIIFNCQ